MKDRSAMPERNDEKDDEQWGGICGSKLGTGAGRFSRLRRQIMRVLAFLVCLAFLPTAFAESPAWQPEKTWVFAVGVLRFKGKTRNDWPEEGRQDAVMLNTMR